MNVWMYIHSNYEQLCFTEFDIKIFKAKMKRYKVELIKLKPHWGPEYNSIFNKENRKQLIELDDLTKII